MKSCFNCDMKITQTFGNILWTTPNYKTIVKAGTLGAVEFYKQWGMKGHNGWDAVPIIVGHDRIYSFYHGKIVQILINHPDYGNGVRIYIKELQVVEYHNHFEWLSADLKLYDNITEKTFLGKMGHTGASIGDHDHIAFTKVNDACFDNNGNLISRLNKDNGYLGYIDPKPFLIGE